MPADDLGAETILIVDDEEPVRRTFREWLEGADLGCQILTAADAESALLQANRQTIDLAILDWNLGAGNDGLQLLEDLALFNADVVAIMITGFAHQATPLDAMRMGVRDYLDKNQDLDRTTFLRAVRRQLDRIRPARRERRLHQGLVAFRAAVEKVLPLVQASAALHDPVPLPEAVHQPVPLPGPHHRRPRRGAAGSRLRRRARAGRGLPRLRRRRPASRGAVGAVRAIRGRRGRRPRRAERDDRAGSGRRLGGRGTAPVREGPAVAVGRAPERGTGIACGDGVVRQGNGRGGGLHRGRPPAGIGRRPTSAPR